MSQSGVPVILPVESRKIIADRPYEKNQEGDDHHEEQVKQIKENVLEPENEHTNLIEKQL